MNYVKTLFWRFGIAGTALLAAVAVYCLARIYPPELLTPFQTSQSLLVEQTVLSGSAPSLFYTFAIGLIVGTCAPGGTSAKLHCLVWIGLALLLEVSQYPAIAQPLASWLAATLSLSTWEFIAPYWNRGGFDSLDVMATVAGGLAALTIITCFPAGDNDEYL